MTAVSGAAHEAPSATDLERFPERYQEIEVDCDVTTICNTNGVCKPGTGKHSFTVSPIEIGAHGEGAYVLTWNGRNRDAAYAPAIGFVLEDSQRESIIRVLGLFRPTAVIHEAGWGTEFSSETTFLNCEPA